MMKPNKNAQRQPFSLDEKQTDPVLQRRAKWVKPGPLDDEMVLRQEYQKDHKGTLGELVLTDDKFFNALEDKKAKEEYLQYLKVGQQLVDPEDPLSQQRAFQIVPELKSLPEEQFDEDLAFQEWIRLLLRDGATMGPEDHKRMMTLMRPEVIIPTGPVWDLDGSFSALTVWSKSLPMSQNPIPKVSSEVIFNPSQWAIKDKDKLNQYLKQLIPVKMALLRRVYPGCRAMDKQPSSKSGDSYLPNNAGESRTRTKLDDWYEEVFIQKQSVITGNPTTNKYFNWWKNVANETDVMETS
jgi:hypothetical protein